MRRARQSSETLKLQRKRLWPCDLTILGNNFNSVCYDKPFFFLFFSNKRTTLPHHAHLPHLNDHNRPLYDDKCSPKNNPSPISSTLILPYAETVENRR